MKKFSKKALCIILSVVIALGSLITASFAKDADGIVIKVSSDKKYYTKGEDIVLDVEVTNTTDEDMSDVDINMDCNWFNFDVEEGSSIKIKELKAGETKTIQFHAKYLRLDLFEFISVMYKRIFAWFCRTLWGANSETTRYSVRVDLIKRTFVFSAEVGGVSENLGNGENLDYEKDTDNDGAADYIEELFGTDIYSDDSDDDGLSDYEEIYLSDTDPVIVDTDNDGVLDCDEDYDGDGLTNINEATFSTVINKYDSDNDGLGDNDEISSYKTDPTNPDTDGDKVSDGKELELGTDPLVADDSFEVKLTSKEEDSVEASVEMTLNGEQVETLSIEKVENNILFPNDIPGYIGSAYDFSVNGTFDSATISFEFDEGLVDQEDFDPAIYYFNEKEQKLELLETTVNGNVASAVTTHFSTYILINRKVFEESFIWEDVWEESNYESVEIVFVVDDSGSMYSNDRYNQRLSVASNLIDKLPQDSKIGIVKFTSSVYLLTTTLTQDKEAAKSYLTSSYFGSSGGTSMYKGINNAFPLFESTDDKVLRLMIVLSDGETSDTSLETTVINTANSMNVKIYTVGLGSSVSYFNSYLKPLAEKTNASFYLSSNASGLAEIYENIGKKIERELDSDDDGIPNWYEDTVIGFNGKKIRMDKNKPDTDGDSLIDSQEVELIFNYNDDKTKVQVIGKMKSLPQYEDSDFDGTNDNLDSKPLDNHFAGIMHYDYNKKDKTCDVEFKVDYSRLITGSNQSYSKDLAVLSMLLSSDVYNKNYIKTTSGAKIMGSDSGTNLGTIIGLKNEDEDLKFMRISSSNDKDVDDITDVAVGHRYYTYGDDNTPYEIIVAAIRGTNGTVEEWSSNFDVGADTPDYYAMTGEHPEWINKKNHKGFDVTATRVISSLNSYISQNVNSSANKIILITGHSRGAAIANIVGKYYEDHSEYKSFTYTFATPNCTTDSNRNSYKTIFNIVNSDDLIPKMPLTAWGFGSYGTTKSVSVEGSYENKWGNAEEGTFEWLVGKDYNNDGGTQRTIDLFKKISSCREDLYKLDETEDGRVWENNIGHTTYSGAQKELKQLEETLKNEKLYKYCKLSIVGSKIYHVEINYCPAYFMQVLSNMTTGNGPLLGRDVTGKYASAKSSFVASSGKVGVGGMTDPHMQPTYYLIARNGF